MQKDLPYLIKKQFVPLESTQVSIARFEHENAPDNVLQGFKQKRDDFKSIRLNPSESITRKNPLASVQQIKVCNSFHMNKKAMD